MAVLLPIVICMGVCPLFMFFMMRDRGMKGMGNKDSADEAAPDAAPKPARAGLSREQQLAELKTQLADSQAQRQVLAEELDQVARGTPPVARGAQSGAEVIAEARGRRHKGDA